MIAVTGIFIDHSRVTESRQGHLTGSAAPVIAAEGRMSLRGAAAHVIVR